MDTFSGFLVCGILPSFCTGRSSFVPLWCVSLHLSLLNMSPVHLGGQILFCREEEAITDHAKILAQEMREIPVQDPGIPKEGWGFAETDAKVSRERKQKIQPEVWSRQGQHQEEEIGKVQEALVSEAKGRLAKVSKKINWIEKTKG